LKYIDVFNGDADGICALVQLYRDKPRDATLITGIKRHINLLKDVEAEHGDQITVLDVSFAKNAADVRRLLNCGATIQYIDHHQTGDIFTHPKLHADIDLSAETCTSIIVDQQLQGRFRHWAITAAFGDNLSKVAWDKGLASGVAEQDLLLLKKFGIYLNYNGYGASLDDLFFPPASLFNRLKNFDDPLDFLQQDSDVFTTLDTGYHEDMSNAEQSPVDFVSRDMAMIILPHAKWARRVGGVYSNDLSNQFPDRAHAVLTTKENGNFLVSVRAPLNRRFGADELVSQFPTGGGRKAAAGINELPKQDLTLFAQRMQAQFKQ